MQGDAMSRYAEREFFDDAPPSRPVTDADWLFGAVRREPIPARAPQADEAIALAELGEALEMRPYVHGAEFLDGVT